MSCLSTAKIIGLILRPFGDLIFIIRHILIQELFDCSLIEGKFLANELFKETDQLHHYWQHHHAPANALLSLIATSRL